LEHIEETIDNGMNNDIIYDDSYSIIEVLSSGMVDDVIGDKKEEEDNGLLMFYRDDLLHVDMLNISVNDMHATNCYKPSKQEK
jgi:hypothetical protein